MCLQRSALRERRAEGQRRPGPECLAGALELCHDHPRHSVGYVNVNACACMPLRNSSLHLHLVSCRSARALLRSDGWRRSPHLCRRDPQTLLEVRCPHAPTPSMIISSLISSLSRCKVERPHHDQHLHLYIRSSSQRLGAAWSERAFAVCPPTK